MRGVVICVATLLVAGAAAQPVAFPLRFYSFEEIAQRMSVGGRRIECAPSLKQRLALIHLKPRDWTQTRALFEAGLDIRLRPTSDADNRWILERAPETLRAERRQREQFARFLEREATRRQERYQVLLDPNVSPEDAARQLVDPNSDGAEVWREHFADTARFMRGAPLQQARRNWRAYQRLREAVDFKLDKAAIQAQIQKLSDGTLLKALGFSDEELAWAGTVAHRPEGRSMDVQIDGWRPDLNRPEEAQLAALLHLAFALQQYVLEPEAESTLARLLRPPVTALECIEQGFVERAYQITPDPELALWLLDLTGELNPEAVQQTLPVSVRVRGSFQELFLSLKAYVPALMKTEQELGTYTRTFDLMALSVEMRNHQAQRVFEQMDAALAQAYANALETHETLMRTPEANQPIKTPVLVSTPLIARLRMWAAETQQEVIAEATYPFDFSEPADTLREWLAQSKLPYLMERRDGVWILRCWAAFLERSRDYPLVSIRNLLESPQDYNAWRRFYRSVSPQQARWLLFAPTIANPNTLTNTPRHRDAHTKAGEFARAWLIMQILEAMPEGARMRLWNADGRRETFPLALLPTNAKRQLAQTLNQWRWFFGGRVMFDTPAQELAAIESLIEYAQLTHDGETWEIIIAAPEYEDSWLRCPLPGLIEPISEADPEDVEALIESLNCTQRF